MARIWSSFARIVLGLAAATALVGAPAKGRADDDNKPAKSARGTKRRALLAPISTRERVGTSAHAVAPTREAPAPRSPASIGSPSEGRLQNGVHLDTSKFIRVVPVYARGDTRWGLPALTHLLEHGARNVAKRYPGSVLGIGDMSRKNGGDLMRHHSHESGRDADVAFYVNDAKGRPLLFHSFVRFDGNLRSTNAPGAAFDEARNWAFVQSILTDPAAHVSHVFVSEPVRQRLLAYARGHHVAHALWTRAALTLMQPSDSEPHDDHMHVRISCPNGGNGAGACIEVATSSLRRAQAARAAQIATKQRALLRTPHHAELARHAAPPASSAPAATHPPTLDRAVESGRDDTFEDFSPFAHSRPFPYSSSWMKE